LAACGEKVIPANRDITVQVSCGAEGQVDFSQGNQKRTSFGKIEALFTEIRNKAEEGDEASEGGANNIEIGYIESRHFLATLRGIKSSSNYIIQFLISDRSYRLSLVLNDGHRK